MGWFLAGSGSSGSFWLLLAGVFTLSGSSAALNQFQERRLDALMERTRNRPLPARQLTAGVAILVSIMLGITGLFLLLLIGLLPALLGLFTLTLYNLLYTPLKRITSFALLPGGLVGAIPPMIGYTAAGGTPGDPIILFVCALMFLWQMPHFWLLLIRYGKEYQEAGFRTVLSYMNEKQVRRMLFFWMCTSSLFLLSYPLFGISLPLWLALILIGANIMVIAVYYMLLFKWSAPKHHRLLFILSNVFLIGVLLTLILSTLL